MVNQGHSRTPFGEILRVKSSSNYRVIRKRGLLGRREIGFWVGNLERPSRKIASLHSLRRSQKKTNKYRKHIHREGLENHSCRTFHLRRKDSEEYKQKKRAERARKEQRQGQAWIIWAVVVVIAVLLGLGYLIFHSSAG